MSIVVDVLAGGVRGGTSIMYAGLGETVSERAGVINLGMEGCMLGGALTGFAVTASTGNPWGGVLAAAGAGALLALVHAVLVVARGVNQFASGLTVYFLALGLTSLFGSGYVGASITPLDVVAVPVLSDIPVLGRVLFTQDLLTYGTYLVVPLLWFVLFRTRVGLLLRTAGERADALTVHGYRVGLVRQLAVVAGGALAGVGGAHLSISYAQSWFENMIVGRGFIAVALVVFAVWQPWRVLAGAWLFGVCLAVSPALQVSGVGINQFALDALPFVVTLIALAALGSRTLRAAPDELRRVLDSTAT